MEATTGGRRHGVADEPRLGAIRTVAGLFKVLGWAVLVLGGVAVVLTTIYVASTDADVIAVISTFIGAAIPVALGGLFSLAVGELLSLVIANYEHNRQTEESLRAAS